MSANKDLKVKWFKTYIDEHNQQNFLAFEGQQGLEGYGFYKKLQSFIAIQPMVRLEIKEFTYEVLAKQMGTDKKIVETLITDLLNYEIIFEVEAEDGTSYLMDKSVLESYQDLEEKSLAGKKGARARYGRKEDKNEEDDDDDDDEDERIINKSSTAIAHSKHPNNDKNRLDDNRNRTDYIKSDDTKIEQRRGETILLERKEGTQRGLVRGENNIHNSLSEYSRDEIVYNKEFDDQIFELTYGHLLEINKEYCVIGYIENQLFNYLDKQEIKSPHELRNKAITFITANADKRDEYR